LVRGEKNKDGLWAPLRKKNQGAACPGAKNEQPAVTNEKRNGFLEKQEGFEKNRERNTSKQGPLRVAATSFTGLSEGGGERSKILDMPVGTEGAIPKGNTTRRSSATGCFGDEETGMKGERPGRGGSGKRKKNRGSPNENRGCISRKRRARGSQ